MKHDDLGTDDLREVRLYGALGKRFGRIHKVSVKSVREAAQALAAVLDGFERYLTDNSMHGFHVFAGHDRTLANNRGEALLDAPLGRGETVYIVPAVAGSKKRGLLQTVVGIVLIVAGAYFGQGWAVQLGIALVVGGVTQMMLKTPKKDGGPNNLPSYHFDGPVNSTTQGVPVQVTMGRMIIGSSVISMGISSSEIAA